MVSTGNLQGDAIAGSVTVGVASFVAILLRIKSRRLRGVSLAMNNYSVTAAVVRRAMLCSKNLLTPFSGTVLGHRD